MNYVKLEARLNVLACAQAVYGSYLQLKSEGFSLTNISPRLLPNNQVGFGNSGLKFSDHAFLHTVKGGFACPQLSSFFFDPLRCTRVVFSLLKVKSVCRNYDDLPLSARVLLRAGLEATVVFMNFHERLGDILRDEKKSCLRIGIGQDNWVWDLFHKDVCGWVVKPYQAAQKCTSKLEFTSFSVAHQSALGKLNALLAVGQGKIKISGKIPFIDKFGYFARQANRILY